MRDKIEKAEADSKLHKRLMERAN